MNEESGRARAAGRAAAGSVGSSRRSILKKGLLGGAILLVGGTVPMLLRPSRIMRAPQRPLRVLTPTEFAIFATAAARICPRDQAASGWPSAEEVDCAGKVDAIMAALHPRATAEFKKLLHVFESGLTGFMATGRPTTFTASSPDDQDRRLGAWRRSRVALFRSGYQAMKRLAHATYYASPEIYPRLGYPGPPTIGPGPS